MQPIIDLLMQVPAPVALVKGPDHRVEMANSIFLRLIECPDLIGRSVTAIFSDSRSAAFSNLLDDVYKTGCQFTANEISFVTGRSPEKQDGEIFLNVVLQPYKLESDVVDSILIFVVDVTEQVISRRKLQQANNEITRFFNTVNEGFFSRDIINNKYIHLSVGCEKIYGYKVEDFYQNSSLWFQVIHPADRSIVLHDDQLHNQGKTTVSEYRIIHKDGSIRWIEIKVVPFMVDGRLVRVEGIINDITERQKATLEIEKARELSNSIINSLPGIFYAFNGDGNFLYWNKNFEKILGYTEDEIRAASMLDFIRPEDKQLAVKAARKILRKGYGQMEAYLVTKEGKEIPYYLKGRVVEFEGKSFIFGTGLNISDRKKAEEEREKMNADLVQRNIELKQFSYIISHNLRSPIAKILGLTAIFENEPNDNPFNQQLIFYIRNEAVNLDNVVKDLNTILSQSGNVKKEDIIFSVELELIKHVLEDDLASCGGQIISDFSEADHIRSIRSFVYSIIFNLISNSIKYRSEKRTLEVYVKTSLEGHNVCLSVQDNGMGIDLEKHRNEVFGLYNRFHAGNIPGSGMGLNLVKTQAETLGGWVELESEPDKGCTFKIYIPLG